MTKKLLLLSCCAPCSVAVIKKLADDQTPFDVAFYNPNIHPAAEYQHRLQENKRVCDLFGVPFIEFEYDPKRWHDLIKGLENEPERGKRCAVCFHMRLLHVMTYAKENDYLGVSSVLGVSRHKDLEQVNRAASQATLDTGFLYVPIEGRRDGMQEARRDLIKELSLYEQNYCGCVFSMREELPL